MYNLTQNENTDELQMWSLFLAKNVESDPGWIPVIFITILIIIFFVGFTGNILTCIVIYYERTLHTSTNFYLFNMAVSDAFASLGIILNVFVYFSDGLLYGDIACKLNFGFVVFLWNNSILVMTILSIERYMAICCPLRKKSAPPLKLIISLIWVIAILETASEIPTVTLITSNSFMICYTVPTTYARIINGILALVTFIIPLGILIYVYSMIAFKVNISDKVNVERNMFNYRGNGGKVNKLLVAMIVSFVICWSPCCILRILIFGLNIEKLMEFDVIWDVGYRIVLINSWLSTILNPLLFSLMSSKFRKAFKNIWKAKIQRRPHPDIALV